jgi:transposase-like protein
VDKEEPLMRKLSQLGREVKAKREQVEKILSSPVEELELDARIALIKDLIPLGLLAVQEALQHEVELLAGKRYERDNDSALARWGTQDGSVYLADQKLPIKRPRVRDLAKGREVVLESYKSLQQPREMDEGLLLKVMQGLSCRRYEQSSEAIPEAFGLSSSTVSRRFVKASVKKLRELTERRLEGLDIVAMILDGKTFQDDQMIVALGITITGHKIVLGFVQAGSENSRVSGQFLRELLERGLNPEAGLLVVIDGSKGLRKAVEEVLGVYALVQRCQWHKRENVVSYLAKTRQAEFRKKLQAAYREPGYGEAKRKLEAVRRELDLINQSAVKSLEEGLEETLTLHRLRMFRRLGPSLKTSNCIESVMSLVGQLTDKVDYWKNSSQKQRWLAAALMDIEPRLTRIRGYACLPMLREAIQRELHVGGVKKTEAQAA